MFFCKLWAPFFEVKQRWTPFLPVLGGFYPDFQTFCQNFPGICPHFQQIKTFVGALATPAPPTPLAGTILLFKGSGCSYLNQYSHVSKITARFYTIFDAIMLVLAKVILIFVSVSYRKLSTISWLQYFS